MGGRTWIVIGVLSALTTGIVPAAEEAELAPQCAAPCCLQRKAVDAEVTVGKPGTETDQDDWNKLIDNALEQVKRDTPETVDAFEKGINALRQAIGSVRDMAESMENNFSSEEFRNFAEKIRKDLKTAAQPIQRIDWEGLRKSMEEMGEADWKALESLTAGFIKDVSESWKNSAETESPPEKDQPADEANPEKAI